MNIPGMVSRKKYDELYRKLLKKEEELDGKRLLERENRMLKEEIRTLNASLDATAAELDQARGALAVSEKARKQLLKERRR